MRHPHIARSSLVLLALLLAAALQAALPGGAAATVTPITEGSVTWGVKESWRNYVGSGTLSGGVTVNPDGTYDFPVVSGSYDDETGTTRLQLAGSVHWQAYPNYQGVPGRWALDTTFKDLSLEIGPTVWEIRGDNIGYSREDPGGELHEETDVVLARLDIDGAVTSFEAGESEWSGVRSMAGPGMGLYPSGTAIDPVTVRYSGPGGLPIGERWDLPGGPALEPGARWVSAQPVETPPKAGHQLYISPAGEVVHVLELTGARTADPTLTLAARDALTLAPVGTSVELAGEGTGLTTAYDPETETIFYVATEGSAVTVHTARWDPEALSYQLGEVGDLRAGAGVAGLAWNPVADELAATNFLSEANGGSKYVKDEIRIFRRVGGVWTKTVETPLPMPASGPFATNNPGSPFGCGFNPVVSAPCLGVLRDGTYIQAPKEATAELNRPWPAIHVEINGFGEAETERIEGTEAQDLGPGISNGFGATAPGADGSLVLHNTSWGRMSWARVDIVDGAAEVVEAPYSVAEQGNEDPTASFGRAVAADPAHGWEWVAAEADPEGFVLSAMRDRAFVGRFKYPELFMPYMFYAAIAVAPDGSVYLPIKDKDTGRFGYQLMRYVGQRANFDTQPVDAEASLESGEEEESVSFTSTVSGGDPAPTRQWQVKPAGEAGFVDIDGETGETLSVDATREMNGNRYRAIYTSEAGAIASEEAALTVNYAPEPVAEPQSQTVTEGADAVFLVAADANPEATISWQRSVSGSWQDIASDDGDFAIDGLSLIVLDADLDQSGHEFRAKLVNPVGTSYSDPATLTVEPRGAIPPEGLDLENVSLEWTGNEELQKAPPAGGSNYFSAGISSGKEATYRSVDGNAAVYQVSALGSESLATWGTRTAHVSNGGGQLARLYGGDARIEPDGSATVQWDGSWSVNFYGGLVPFTFTDPELSVAADGSGTLSADLTGCASSIADPSVCVPFAPAPGVTVANFSGVEINPSGEVEITPDYAGVEVVGDPTKPQVKTTGWGSWPQSFVSFHVQTGLAGYWYSTGSGFDADKASAPFVVDFQGDLPPAAPPLQGQPADTPPPDSDPNSGFVSIVAFKQTQTLGGKRVARLATLTCPQGAACKVSVPRRVQVKLGGKRYPLVVLAPQRIGAGKQATLRLRFSKPALQALSTRKRPTTVRLRVGAGGQAYEVLVVLQGAGQGKARVVRVDVRKIGTPQ